MGDKITFADLAFVPWHLNMDLLLGEGKAPNLAKEYPSFSAWNEKMINRPAIKKIVEDRQKASDAEKKQ